MTNLYNRVSVLLTDAFIKNGIIPESKKEVYAYGFETMLSLFTYTAVFIGLAAITKTMLASVIFWIGFFVIRTISGGFHAKTYLGCHMLFMMNHVLFILIYRCCSDELQMHAAPILIIVSSLIILIFAPVDHPNKPFIKTERKRFRILSCIASGILIVLATINLVMNNTTLGTYSLCFAIGVFSAAISLMSAKIINKKGESKA